MLRLFLLAAVVAVAARADTGNRKTDARLTTTILPLAFLVLYSAGALLLNTAHNGGRLGHNSASGDGDVGSISRQRGISDSGRMG